MPILQPWKKKLLSGKPYITRQYQKIMEKHQEGIFPLEAPVDEPPTSDATSGHVNCDLIGQGISELLTCMVLFSSDSVTGSRMRGVQKWSIASRYWANTGGPIPHKEDPLEWPQRFPFW
ncbi:hypothetical protein O181_073710 [Austropuccinia psidii MF-1]|uniref:Uncharacterized protein n=1 Tax=Austropuccinia psidii MF-1 TaxID=1389203 RepID=A0A9Q3ICA9_9BASI|nr:hypothetical protein [Austropuccinia psidii MF-1]